MDCLSELALATALQLRGNKIQIIPRLRSLWDLSEDDSQSGFLLNLV